MEVAACFLIFILTLTIFIFVSISRKPAGPESRGKLPPGSMDWPYIGESFHLYSKHPNVFFASKQKRYGEIFKTHILGCPAVMLASPEAARFVLVTQAHLFKPTYPKSKENFIGPTTFFFHQGEYHLRLRKLVQSSITLNALRGMVQVTLVEERAYDHANYGKFDIGSNIKQPPGTEDQSSIDGEY